MSDPNSASGLHTAVLYADYGTAASIFDDWRDAFERSPVFATRSFDVVRRHQRKRFASHLATVDVVVLLHSVLADNRWYAERIRSALQSRRGKLVVFMTNEFNRVTAAMPPRLAYLEAVEPDIVATQLLPEAGDFLYAGIGGKVVSVAHALNPRAFRPEVDLVDRPIDIGGRSVRYHPHVGDNDRNRLYHFFAEHGFDPDLKVDLSTETRLDRVGWSHFLNQCRGTVATEAGSWYLERDDSIVRRMAAWQDQQGLASRSGGIVIGLDSRLRRLTHRLPWSVKRPLRRILNRTPIKDEAGLRRDTDFETIHRLFFADAPRNPAYSKAVSSRHFDAIGTKTCQILIRGRYNDILQADEHYIALDHDFGNIKDVMTRFRDDTYVRAMVDRSYEYVMDRHTHAHRLDDILAAL